MAQSPLSVRWRTLGTPRGASRPQPPSLGHIQCGSNPKRVAVSRRCAGQDSRLWSMRCVGVSDIAANEAGEFRLTPARSGFLSTSEAHATPRLVGGADLEGLSRPDTVLEH